tara:strand:- start:5983 stop:6639 length:657 start_codon:yes stop_codon:yes gene_type:complete
MFDLICTFHNYKELERQVSIFKDSNLKPKYICNWENKSDIDNLENEVHWLNYNPDKHMGAYALATSASPLIENDYVFHYHADIKFHNLESLISSFKEFKKSNKKLGGIPRQWVFDNENKFIDNKSIPFRSECFFIKSDLYKQIFNINNLNQYRNKCIENGHPSLHFEPLIYAAAEINGVDFNKDIYYLEDVKQMKELHSNNVFYYDVKFHKTQIERIK